MKIFKHCILLLLFIAGISCKKKQYPQSSTDGSPVFNCSMNVNGNPVSLQAGINNYYMYSSYLQDSNNVCGFIAGLKQIDCSNCPNSIQIQLNDFKISQPNATTQTDSSFRIGNYNYLGSNASAFYTAQFQSSYNKPVASYLWDFGDGTTSSQANPLHVYKTLGKYTISLSVTGVNSCISTISDVKQVGVLTNNSFRTEIVDSSSIGNYVSFFANSFQGTPPYSYLWNFGDGSALSATPTPNHLYPYTGSYPVTLRVIDQNNDTAYAKYNLVTQNDASSCAANYTISSVNLTPNTLGLSAIEIKWTDANGLVYTSKNALQPANSYFTIVSVEDYQKNNNNQPTKKLHVKFKCTVYNGSNSIIIDNGDAYISFAYK